MPDWLLLAGLFAPWVGIVGAVMVLRLHHHDLYHHTHVHEHSHDHEEFGGFSGKEHEHPLVDLSKYSEIGHDHPHDHNEAYATAGHTHDVDMILVKHVHSWVMDGTTVGPDERVMVRYRCDATPPCNAKMVQELPPESALS